MAAVAVLALLGVAGCGGDVEISPHPPSSSPCSAYRDVAWPPQTDIVAWHPEGSEIYLSTGPPAEQGHAVASRIYAIASDGSRLAPIVRTGPVVPSPEAVRWRGAERLAGPATNFALSPDGAHLVYSTCAFRYGSKSNEWGLPHLDYLPELARAEADGSRDIRLTENSAIDDYPAWSPDGSQIAFLSNRTDGEAGADPPADQLYKAPTYPYHRYPLVLYTMAVDGSNVRAVLSGQEMPSDGSTKSTGSTGVAPSGPKRDAVTVIRHPPRWSPDGRRIAIVGYEGCCDRPLSIYTVGADGTDLRRLTDTVSGLSWSPDGRRLAFAKPDGAEVALYTIAADGTDAQRVTTIPGRYWNPQFINDDPNRAWIEAVTWSPDGSKILYTCGGICVVALDGTLASGGPLPGFRAAWSPDGSQIATVTRPPDGSTRQYGAVSIMAPDGSDLRVLASWDHGGGLNLPGSPQLPKDWAGSARCAGGTAVPEPAANPGLVLDCETLLELRDALAGTEKLYWTAGYPIIEWEGITVGGSPPRVTEITLNGAELRGIIPVELGRLTHLRVLDLSENKLGGAIPAELGGLSRLLELRLTENYVGGSIPPELSGLAQLQELNLANNLLTGGIPAELGQLVNLQTLRLDQNQLMDALPGSLGQLADLSSLNLGYNQLAGAIPHELGWLANLTRLDLSRNQLTGPIPTTLGQLRKLTSLHLRRNQLTGPVPAEFGQLAELEWLDLSDNALTGEIPPELSQAAKLTFLDLSRNQLTGGIPKELGELTALRSLRVVDNQLCGLISSTFRKNRGLTLRIEGNQLATACRPNGV